VVDILHEIKKYRDDVFALFVGKGGEEEKVKMKATEYQIMDRVVLAGWRDDVAEIMKGADVFVFPRIEYPREGLGLVVVESQAAGLPMVLSNGIVEDAVVIDELARFIPLHKGPAEWARQIHEMLENGKPLTADEARSKVEASAFNLPLGTDNLIKLYPFQ
jgi:glycosyltransferase involved in cell wall biosynthesis